MPAATPIRFEFDRAREVRWTKRADARLSSQDYTISRLVPELAKPRRALFAMCLCLWAALQDREHPFALPEDVAEHLDTEEQQIAALAAIKAMLEEAGLVAISKKKPASDETASATGLEPSSS